MKPLRLALVVAAIGMAAPASAGELALSFKDGRVTLKATDVTLRQVLNEWARLGQTRIVGLEKLGGGLLTLELTNVPEKRALEILLRSIAGYAAAPRASVAAGADMAANLSHFDRLMLLPTSIASAAPMAPPRPAAAFAPPPQAPFPDPIQLANEEAADAEEGPPPPGVPVFNPNGEPVMPALPAPPGGGPMPGQIRAPGPDDPNAQAPVAGPAPAGTAPLVITRPGVIPVPQTPPRP